MRLVSPADIPVARAKLNEAESSAALARQKLAQSVVRAPMAGTVYQFDLRVGSFLNPGDLVANIGRLEKVRVKVYVDEPDLGRIGNGMPVTITWDAMPGRKWKGSVDKLPTEIVPLGSRQVGEVGCVIANPGRDLLPGTNINAEIQSKVVPNALVIPTAALHREGGATTVYRPVRGTVRSATHPDRGDQLHPGSGLGRLIRQRLCGITHRQAIKERHEGRSALSLIQRLAMSQPVVRFSFNFVCGLPYFLSTIGCSESRTGHLKFYSKWYTTFITR